ncbi:MAG: alkane 1-monooxygenase [Flavobacteriaceae bacterium]|nr:alkane 1-monooxygenase [Bacteroidota bacterium]
MKDLKYLLAYSIPLVTIFALNANGVMSFATVIYAYICIPLLEVSLADRDEHYSEEEKQNRLNNIIFDVLLYLNIPFVFGLLFYGLWQLSTQELSMMTQLGHVLSLGILLATNGINVAHELGHRVGSNVRFLGKLLLCPSLYMHFYIEHNFGHHKNVATPEDPASAKKNQTVYGFWFTSIWGQIKSAYRIQKELLAHHNRGFFSLYNDLLWYALIQMCYLIVLYMLFGVNGVLFGALVALLSVLMLETINYIEHYGLERKKVSDHRYERVLPIHSWNSNHIIGRLVLYELTRHSDHHHRAGKKYQILENKKDSPQLPWGYPTSMLVALMPPLWFHWINPRLKAFEKA